MLEEVGEKSALEQVGLRAGDRLHAWRSLSKHGDLRSGFDWWWLKVEQAPRGPIELEDDRNGEDIVFTVEPAEWQAAVRPAIAEPLLSTYLSGKARLDGGETHRPSLSRSK